MHTDLSRIAIDAIVDAVAERIHNDIQKAVLAANVRFLAGGKAVVSRDEAGIVLNQSPRTLEKWASEGTGPRLTRFGRSIGHTVEALGEYVDLHQYPAHPPSLPPPTRPRPRAAVKRRVAEVKIRATPAELSPRAKPSKTSQPASAADKVPAE